MAKTLKLQQAIALAVALTLGVPLAAFAADGKKHFKEGLKYEENRQWDKAAQEFTLAVAEKPSNVEYTLHLQRALVSAAIMLVERGDNLADKKDYNAAYNAYRQAFASDPTNELALIKMRRMLEAQGLPTDGLPHSGDSAGPSYRPARDSNTKASYGGAASVSPMKVQMPAIPGRKFPKTDVVYRDTNILTAVEQLAQLMKLNVMFDQMVVNQFKMLKVTVELRDVTYPNALEWILKTNNMMYAQIGARTIVIAADNPQQRGKYEPFAVRTFYVKNADLEQVKAAIQGALQIKQITSVKQLNAMIVRDTPSNLELVENMIDSLDKSKAEVLVDVNIYEVSRTDLLQLGSQFNVPGGSGSGRDLTNLGGIGQGGSTVGFAHNFVTNGIAGLTLGLPPTSISMFQNKGKAKLLASTQIHMLDNEQNAVRIGQRVPIQTASLPSYSSFTPTTTPGQGTNPNQTGQNLGLNNAFGYGVPQIQYENVGLNIDVTPKVYEDDVEMKMKIETTSVDGSAGNLTPTFNQRTMTSVARVRDGQTTLVAGVSQNIENRSVKGLPLIGLIPILGRFFATPETNNRQSDVVITVTPHILRRADITEKDHLARAAGDALNPTNQLKIDQILYLADLDDAQPNQVAETPPAAAPESKTQPVSAPPSIVNTRSDSPGVVVQTPPMAQAQPLKPNVIKTTVSRPGVQTSPSAASESRQVNQVKKQLDDDDDDDDETATNQHQAPLMVYVRPNSAAATRGQDFYVAVIVNGNGEVSSAHITMTFDGSLLEVKGVRDSGMLSNGARAELQFNAEGGLLNIQLDRPQGTPGVPARGQLCLVVFTVKAPGQSPLVLNDQQTQFRNSTGQALPIKVHSSQVDIR